ncbi:MAG: HAD family hydrolase [Devosiaceae bacterium]|nr:HAD family hydrolase [Devosiaceae bacterium MH13]
MRPRRTIELVSFDADQTLFDFERTRREALDALSAHLAAEHGLHLSPDALQAQRDRVASDPVGKGLPLLEQRHMALETLLSNASDKPNAVAAAMDVFKAVRFGRMHLLPGAKTVLRQLSSGYRLAMVTNGNSDPEHTALAGLFDHVLMAERLPYKKPDPAIFEHLFALANVTDPSRVAHVGDSLRLDVAPANAVGAISIWLNASGAQNQSDLVPTAEIRQLTELPEALDALPG